MSLFLNSPRSGVLLSLAWWSHSSLSRVGRPQLSRGQPSPTGVLCRSGVALQTPGWGAARPVLSPTVHCPGVSRTGSTRCPPSSKHQLHGTSVQCGWISVLYLLFFPVSLLLRSTHDPLPPKESPETQRFLLGPRQADRLHLKEVKGLHSVTT